MAGPGRFGAQPSIHSAQQIRSSLIIMSAVRFDLKMVLSRMTADRGASMRGHKSPPRAQAERGDTHGNRVLRRQEAREGPDPGVRGQEDDVRAPGQGRQ